MMRYAITRAVSVSLDACELTHQGRVPIDLDLARQQHAAYEACLERLDCTLIRLPEMPDSPDAVFVEDTALILDEVALITRPGAESRRGETPSIAESLAPYRKVVRIEAPATVDGGDVLVVGHDIYVGLTSRSNGMAVDQMQRALSAYGYRVQGVEVRGCLHLKSAVTVVAENTLLINPAWVEASRFDPFEMIEIHPDEAYAANGLRLDDTVIYPVTFPRTCERLTDRGIAIEPVDLSELAKAEGAVTCCSLIFSA